MRLAPLLLYLFDLANLIIPKIRCYFYVKALIKCIFYQINQASARIILVGKLSNLYNICKKWKNKTIELNKTYKKGHPETGLGT
jgi:hypothetical protein